MLEEAGVEEGLNIESIWGLNICPNGVERKSAGKELM